MKPPNQSTENPFSYQDNYCDEISEMVYPFFSELKITFFSHVRVSHTGIFKSLMTQTSLSKFYLDHKYPIRYSLGKGIILNSGCYVLNHLPDISSAQELNLIKEHYNFDHLIYLVDKQSKWDDLYIFGTTPENQVYINLVFNNMDFIKQGLHRYKYNSRKLLEQTPGAIYPSHCFMNHTSVPDYKINSEQTNLQKILLPLNGSEVPISKQEYKCLGLLVQNYTIKQIGQQMNLSPRTVETYLKNLKNKLHCQGSLELIQLVKNIYLF
jgi:DNA-binding CsgD family transcriptional regulator